MSLYPLHLARGLVRRSWGGQRLAAWLDLPQPWPNDLAESWQVYEANVVLNGSYAGRTLASLVVEHGAELVGTVSLARYGLDFPLLAKYLDANEALSVQVHPDDDYAHTVEAHTGFHGKTEAWYILEAEPGTRLVFGLKSNGDRESFAQAVAGGTLEDCLNYVRVDSGDVLFVPPGTLHAISAGIMLFEIQQKSDLTYRVYDYGRRDGEGNLRALHLEKAMDVLHYGSPERPKASPLALAAGCDLMVACPFFVLERHTVDTIETLSTRPTSFEIWSVIAGEAELAGEHLATGDSLVLPACLGAFTLKAASAATLLRCYVPDVEADLLAPLRRMGYSEERIAETVRLTA
jgi:mannose-6-phosphate isomerase